MASNPIITIEFANFQQQSDGVDTAAGQNACTGVVPFSTRLTVAMEMPACSVTQRSWESGGIATSKIGRKVVQLKAFFAGAFKL
jgi:hypothetical protein